MGWMTWIRKAEGVERATHEDIEAKVTTTTGGRARLDIGYLPGDRAPVPHLSLEFGTPEIARQFAERYIRTMP